MWPRKLTKSEVPSIAVAGTGEAELEADLIYRERTASRTRAQVLLTSDAPAQVQADAVR